LADQFDIRFITSGYAGGVHGFCLTTDTSDVLAKYLELVMAGEIVIPAAVIRAVADMAPSQREPVHETDVLASNSVDLETCRLSVRERQILRCLKVGAPNKVIARKLTITEATIKVHVKAILRKIGVSNRTKAAMWAYQNLRDGRKGSANV
jgi:two-component system nitrate/nitrite response regulator NarL